MCDIGIVTLEDALESLLREDIYDEFDKVEREEKRLAKWVAAKWKRFVNKKKSNMQEASLRHDPTPPSDATPLLAVPHGSVDEVD